MSVRRQRLVRLLLVAVVASVVGLVLPTGPASAEEDCRWTPTPRIDCLPMIPPVEPPRMLPGPPEMTPTPDPRPIPPGELCGRVLVRDGIFIIQTGVSPKFVYSFNIEAAACRRNGVVTRPDITSSIAPANPLDRRIRRITATSTEFSTGVGTSRFVQREQVFFTACGDPFNVATCRNFRHYVDIVADGAGNIDAFPFLEVFEGQLPI